jgi:type II secretory pathway component PulJ
VSVLWVLPLVFVAVGSLLLVAVVRQTADAAAALQAECTRLDELRTAIVSLRGDAAVTRAKLEHLGSRSEPVTPGR